MTVLAHPLSNDRPDFAVSAGTFDGFIRREQPGRGGLRPCTLRDPSVEP